MLAVRFVALVSLLVVACGARSEIASPHPDGGSETPPCGAGFSCPSSGTWYDCMPPETPTMQLVCEGACHDWIVASCPGVGFAY